VARDKSLFVYARNRLVGWEERGVTKFLEGGDCGGAAGALVEQGIGKRSRCWK